MAFSLSLIAGFKAGLTETASSQNRFFHPSPKGYLEKLNQLILHVACQTLFYQATLLLKIYFTCDINYLPSTVSLEYELAGWENPLEQTIIGACPPLKYLILGHVAQPKKIQLGLIPHKHPGTKKAPGETSGRIKQIFRCWNYYFS